MFSISSLVSQGACFINSSGLVIAHHTRRKWLMRLDSSIGFFLGKISTLKMTSQPMSVKGNVRNKSKLITMVSSRVGEIKQMGTNMIRQPVSPAAALHMPLQALCHQQLLRAL